MTWENKKKSIVIMLYLDENNSHSTVYIHPIEEILASTALDPNAKPFEMKFSNLNQDDVEPILLDKTTNGQIISESLIIFTSFTL